MLCNAVSLPQNPMQGPLMLRLIQVDAPRNVVAVMVYAGMT